jgi:nitroreductase
VYLQAAALGLGTVAVGAFEDGQVAQIAGLRPGEEPLLLLPVGWKQE